MSLANQTLSDGRTVKATIHSLVCEHMPTAAVVSGLVTPVDVSGTVTAAVAAHGWRAVESWTLAAGATETVALGLTWVKKYCEAHGLPASDMFTRPFRAGLLTAAMRDEANATK